LTGARTPLLLTFDSWSYDEGDCPSYDAEYISVTTNGEDWINISECPEYPLHYGCESEEWCLPYPSYYGPITYDLSEFAGEVIQIKFEYNTLDDCCGFEEGWYIDDVSVYHSDGIGDACEARPSGGGRPTGGTSQNYYTGGTQNFNLGPNGRVTFYYQNILHILRILGIHPGFVDFILTSEAQEFSLMPGETQQIDVDGDGTKDLLVTLTSIAANQQTANVRMEWIAPELPTAEPVEEPVAEEVVVEEPAVEEEVPVKEVKTDVAVLAILAILGILVVFYALTQKKKTRRY